jgi:hypothetical protein
VYIDDFGSAARNESSELPASSLRFAAPETITKVYAAKKLELFGAAAPMATGTHA